MPEPHTIAWADQFGAQLRDKVKALIVASEVSGLDSLAHAFYDQDGDMFRLVMENNSFILINDDMDSFVTLDLDALGVFR